MSLAFRDRVAAYFKDRPHVWIDGDDLRTVGGKYAYRTRISDCRRELKMNIENKQEWRGAFRVSLYRYVPTPGEASPSHTANLNAWELR